LDYYGARFYDPVVGVFVSADTVQGNAQGMNPYGYVGGNPETLINPSGEFSICIFVCIDIGTPAPEPKIPSDTRPSVPDPIDWGWSTTWYPPSWDPPLPPNHSPGPAEEPPLVEPQLPPDVNIQITQVAEPYPNVVHNSGGEAQPPEEKPKEEPKRNPEADEAQKRANEIKDQMVKQYGWWFRKEVTVGVTIGKDQGGDEHTDVTINETALEKWGEQVKGILEPDENFIMGEVGGPRHAEEVLVQHAKESSLGIDGIGASTKFCGESSRNCAAMLQQELGSAPLGQDI
jgi:hypothetical protein